MADKERSWDHTVEYLAYLGLASASAYAGVKYFPSVTLRKAANIMGAHLAPYKEAVKDLVGPVRGIFGRGPQSPTFWGHGRPRDLTLLHEVETAISAFKSDSRVSGANIDQVTRSLLRRHAADVPQAVGSMTPLTVKDFLSKGMGLERLKSHVGAESVQKLQDSIQELVRLPGFRQSLARQGMTVEQFMGRVPVGSFMMKTPQGVLNTRGGGRALLEDLSELRLPFTNFRPLSLLIPDLSPKPGMSFLGPKTAGVLFGAKDALFVQGNVYPMTEDAGKKILGRPSPGFRLAATREKGAARAAAARMGLLKPSRPAVKGRRDQPRIQRLANIFLRKLQRRTGVGPGWSGRRSRFENILGRARAIATGARNEFPSVTGTPAAGVTPEGGLLRNLLRRPVGEVSGVEDLTAIERARLWFGGEIGRPFLKEGKYISQVVARRKNMPAMERIMPRPFGAAKYYPTRGTGVSDWMNNQITRPLWLLSEMTGLGVKPGGTPLASLGQIGLKLALPAYVGYQALEYAEYKSNRWLGFGPITGPAYLYTRARVGAQSVLDAVGVTDFLQDMEEQYPGSVDSPASRGIRAGATVVAGLVGARSVSSGYAKIAAIAGGAALGYLQLAGISQPADELTRIYAGEQDVPVRSGRWWVGGRHPFGGGKIKFWQPGWYHRLKTRPKEIGLYGSRQESWRGSWLPTPENMFLLKNIWDPYYLEREHFETRPYPKTAGMFGDIPLVGPLAERTVGRALKPVIRRETPISVGTGGMGTPGAQNALLQGYGPIPGRAPTPQADRLDIMTGETIHRLFDWTGLPGFMIGALGEQVLGKEGWYLNRRAEATSDAMAGAQRDYYDRNLGGLLGSCFIAGTKISTSCGRKPIEDVVVGDLVVSGDGRLRPVTGTLKKQAQDLIRLKIANLSSEIIGTSSHHIPVYQFYPCHDKNSHACVPGTRKHCNKCTKSCKRIIVQDKNLGSIEPGDWVCTPIRPFGESQVVIDLSEFTSRVCIGDWIYNRASELYAKIYDILYRDPKITRSQLRDMGFRDKDAKEARYIFHNGNPLRFSRYITITPKVANLIGWWVAKGSVEDSGRVTFSLGEDDLPYVDDLCMTLKEVFGAESSISPKAGKGFSLRSQCIPLSLLLRSLFGTGAANKSIPECIKQMPREELLSFFRGVVLSDGWSNEHAGGYTSASGDLCRDLFDIGLMLGLTGNITIDYTEHSKNGLYPQGTPRKDTVRSYIQWSTASKLYYLLYGKKVSDKRHPVRSFIQDDKYFVKVLKCEPISSEPVDVYDLEIEDLHYYVAGHILVHNTEMFRRFLPNDQGYRTINPLENRMPDWLPGHRSAFRGDRESFIDFHSGDAFSKIEKGEMRLPGAGWEASHRGVDDGTPGMYSALDRFQILADAAPSSQALKHYRKMVEGQIQLGQLSRQDIKRFVQVQDQMNEQLKSRVGAAGYRYGRNEFATKKVTVASTGNTTFTTVEHPGTIFKLAGVEGRPYALANADDKYGRLRRKLAGIRGQTVSMTYGGFGPQTPAILGDVNRWAIDVGMGKHKPVDDLDFRAKHGTNIIRQSYENLVHTTLPGPLGYPRTKFLGQMSPEENYEQYVRQGTWDTGWEHPVQNYLVPWTNQLLGSTSSAQQRVRRVNEYMDNYKYVKYRSLAQRAVGMGDVYTAGQFADRASETLVAANPYAPDFYSDIFGALPPTERPYFAAFAGVTSEKRQEQILKSVPENLAPIYMGVWDRMAGTDGFSSPVLRRYADEARKRFQTPPETRVGEYFAHERLPANDYAGWSPLIDEDSLRVKLGQQEALDIHQMGMWPSQEIKAEEIQVQAPTEVPEMSRNELYEILRQQGYTQLEIMGALGRRSRMTFSRPRSRRWRQAYQNFSLQGAI